MWSLGMLKLHIWVGLLCEPVQNNAMGCLQQIHQEIQQKDQQNLGLSYFFIHGTELNNVLS